MILRRKFSELDHTKVDHFVARLEPLLDGHGLNQTQLLKAQKRLRELVVDRVAHFNNAAAYASRNSKILTFTLADLVNRDTKEIVQECVHYATVPSSSRRAQPGNNLGK